MAPDAQLMSGAIATSWPTSGFPRFTANFHVNFSSISTYGPYRAAFITGVTGPGGTRTADVINSSYVGTQSSAGVDRLAGTLDALVNENPRTLLTVAAGNLLSIVPSPGSAYNNMAVAALSPNGGLYDVVSSFSNGGPSDYSDPSGAFASQVRQVIDIAAPGENFAVAYYGGQTGGNGPTVSGPANGPAGGLDWYTRNISGTSFASPTVGGGAALLYDAAYDLLAATPDARDARVMKAVLMNSADKTLDWDNGQSAHSNGNGGVMTMRGLDNDVGAGRMNLHRAFDQLLGGTTDVVGLPHGLLGVVDPIGWDFGEVIEGLTNDYLIGGVLEAGSTFTSTLTWFRDRTCVEHDQFHRCQLRQSRSGAVERVGRLAAESHLRVVEHLQQHRALPFLDSRDGRVHAPCALEERAVRHGERCEHRAVRLGVVRRRGAGAGHMSALLLLAVFLLRRCELDCAARAPSGNL